MPAHMENNLLVLPPSLSSRTKASLPESASSSSSLSRKEAKRPVFRKLTNQHLAAVPLPKCQPSQVASS